VLTLVESAEYAQPYTPRGIDFLSFQPFRIGFRRDGNLSPFPHLLLRHELHRSVPTVFDSSDSPECLSGQAPSQAEMSEMAIFRQS